MLELFFRMFRDFLKKIIKKKNLAILSSLSSTRLSQQLQMENFEVSELKRRTENSLTPQSPRGSLATGTTLGGTH